MSILNPVRLSKIILTLDGDKLETVALICATEVSSAGAPKTLIAAGFTKFQYFCEVTLCWLTRGFLYTQARVSTHH